jgi:hypothetical protein
MFLAQTAKGKNFHYYPTLNSTVPSLLYLRNKSWKPECVLSFNMDWWILVFYPEPEASMIYFDSDMS